MGFFESLFGGGKSSGMNVNIPDFYEDPYYRKSQDILFGKGRDILAGQPGQYYGAIGESGGDEFQKMMNAIIRDTTRATQEDAIARGVGRGGIGTSAIARNVADVSAKYGYQDMLRAMQGRQFLLGAGSDMLSGVRGAGLQFGQQKNAYGLDRANLQLRQEAVNQEIAASEGKLWSDIISGGIGTAATLYGMGKYKNILGAMGNATPKTQSTGRQMVPQSFSYSDLYNSYMGGY